jgi:hypothetical protein
VGVNSASYEKDIRTPVRRAQESLTRQLCRRSTSFRYDGSPRRGALARAR